MNKLKSFTLAALLLAPLSTLHAGETNRVEIDAKETGAVISPLLFGHNLEHTRRAIWQGISAEMVANRKFAATDCGLPVRWTTLGGSGVAIDNKVAYCSFLLFHNKTWSDYKKPQTTSHWFLSALMGAIWMPSVALYGRAAVMMGDLGSSAGWGLYMGVVILVSTLWGFVTGEWRGVHGKPIRLIIIGVVLLLIAISFIGYGTTL